MHPPLEFLRFRGFPARWAVAAAALLWLGAAEARAQTASQPVCEVDVPPTGTEQVIVSTSTRRTVFQMRFAVSPGCAKVIRTGPLRVAFFIATFQSEGANNGGPVAAEAPFGNQQPVHTGYGPAAANGYSPRRSYWDFPASEVQAAADSGGYLQIPLRLQTSTGGANGFRYFLTRTSADRLLNNGDRQATRSLTAGENILIGTARRKKLGGSPGRGGSRGFDQTTQDPTSTSHPENNADAGWYPRSDYYQLAVLAGYPATPVASAPASVNEGQTITLSSNGSRLASIFPGLVMGLRNSGFGYNLAWVQVTDATGDTAVSDADKLSITLVPGGLIHTGRAFTLRLQNATVTAPDDLTEPTTLYFRLDITSMLRGRASNRRSRVVSVVVNDTDPPAAAITMADGEAIDNGAITVDEDTMTVLTATATDPDGDAGLSYRWTLPGGPTADGLESLTPTVTWPSVAVRATTSFSVAFVVTDSQGLESDTTLQVTVRDTTPPTASTTGSDASVQAGAMATLNGSSSRRAGGGSPDDATGITFNWVQVESATATTGLSNSDPDSVTLSDATAATPTFTAPANLTTLHFLLTVTDAEIQTTATARAAVRVATAALMANAGADQAVTDFDGDGTATTVTLSGLAAMGNLAPADFAYAWAQVASESDDTEISSSDSGYAGALTNGNTATATFTAPNVPTTATYYFQLTVNQTGMSATDTDVVAITVNDNEAPTATINTAAAGVDEGGNTQLNASGSDPDGDTTLTYAWTVSPETSPPTFDDASTASPTVTWPTLPDNVPSRDYTLTLTVTDSRSLTDTATVVFTVQNQDGPPTARAGTTAENNRLDPGATVMLRGDGSTNAVGGTTGLNYAWIQTADATSSTALTSGDTGYVMLSAANVANPTFTAPSTDATLHFLLTVTDTMFTTGATTDDTDRVEVRVALPARVVVSRVDGNLTEGGTGFGFQACRQSGGGQDVTGAIRVVATIRGTPDATDNDADPGMDFVTTRGGSVTTNTGVLHLGENICDDRYNLFYANADRLLEREEAFLVTFSLAPGFDSGGVPIYLADGAASEFTLADRDSATAAIARQDADGFAEGGSGGAATAIFRVTVNGAELSTAATVTFTLSGGTPGDDFTVDPAADMNGNYTLTVASMPDGTPDSADITLTQMSDADMDSETITVTITGIDTNGVGTASIASSPMNSAGATLVDDDGTTMAELSIAHDTDSDGFRDGVGGNAGRTSFTVTLSAVLPATVTADFSITGEVSAADYDISVPAGIAATATGGSVTIVPGQTTAAITLAASRDNLLEGDETLTITLSNITTSGPTVMVTLHSTDSAATATLRDGNSPTVTLTAPADNLDETPTGNMATNHQGVFTVAITGAALVGEADLAFSVTGCGTGQSADCTFAPASPLKISAAGDGSQRASITVTAIADALNEPSQTITVSLDELTVGSTTLNLSAVADASTAIDDDDPVFVAITRSGGTGEVTDDDGNHLGYDEAGSLNFKITLTGGTRDTGIQTLLDIAVVGLSADGLRPNEFQITKPAGQQIRTTLGRNNLVWSTTSITIPHDESELDIELNLIGDELNEAHETLRFFGSRSGASALRFGQIGGGPIRYGAIQYTTQNSHAVITSLRDDDDLSVSLVAASGTDVDTDTAGIQVREGSTVVVQATMNRASAAAITFQYSSAIAMQANLEGQDANGGDMGRGREANADFFTQGTNLQFSRGRNTRVPARQTTADIRIEIKTDQLAEGDETLTVTLGAESITSATRGPIDRGDVSVDLIIVANSAVAHDLSLSGPASLNESDAAQTYTITRNGPVIPDGEELTVVWGFQNGVGENRVDADDFTGGPPAGGSLDFSGSETTKTFTIDPAQDHLAEGGADGEENFRLTLARSIGRATNTALGGVQVSTRSFAVSLGDSSDNLVVAIASRSASPFSEDDGTVTWRISVTGATSTAAVTVPFTIMNTGANTALTTDDYDITAPGGIAANANGGDLIIQAGDGGTANMCGTCGTITVTARSDTQLEGPEELTLRLGTPTGGGGIIALSPAVTTPGSEAPAGGARPATITDTDALTATLSGGGAVAEGGNAEVTVTLSGATHTANVVLAYTVGADTNAATADASSADYDFTTGDSITIAPGASSGVIRIAIADDNLNETGETFTVSVANGQITTIGAVMAAASPRTFSITDDDPITYAIAPASGQGTTLSEGGSASFTITLSGGRLPANARVVATVSGAVDSGDYDITAPGGIGEAAQSAALMLAAQSAPTSGAATVSGVFSLSLTADDLNEAAETLTVRIAAPEFSGSGVLTAGETSATLSIRQSDPLTVSVSRSAGTGGVDEGQTVVFRIALSRRSGGAISVPWTAQMGAQMHREGQGANSAGQPDISVSGITPTVENGITALSGTLQIAAGGMEGTVTVTANSDGLNELEESFTFSIRNPSGNAQSGAVSLGSPAQITAGINPAAHIVRVQGPNAALAEGGTAEFTLRLPASTTSPRSTPLTVAYTLSGGAPGADYANSDASGSATFSVSETQKPVRIAILSDGLNEGEETYTLTLGAVTNANSFPGGAIALGSATVTVEASNPATYRIDGASAAEPAQNAAATLRIPVTLSARSAAAVTIPFSIGGGSATAGADYTPPAPLRLTIPAGQMSADIEISLLADQVHEADETILITLGATPGVGSGGGAVSLSTADGANTGAGTISGNDPLEVEIRLVNAAQTSVSEGAPVALRLDLATGGAAATSQGDVFVTFTTEMVQQNAAAGAAPNTGETGADIALPENNCGDNPAAATVAANGSATGCVRIPAGQSSQQFSIQTLYDNLDENGADNSIPGEQVTLRLTAFASSLDSSAAAIELTSASQRQTQSFTIRNIDSRRQLSLRASATALQEAEEAQLVFSLAMTGADAASSFDIAWEITGASTANAADTTGARSGTLTIPAGYGAGSAALQITTLGIIDDALNEGPETLTLRLSEAPGHSLMTAGGRPGTFPGPATTISMASVTATIAASDPIAAGLARRAGDAGRLVSGDAARFTATLGAAASPGLMLDIAATLGGSAVGVPAVAVNAGSATVDFEIPPCDSTAAPPRTTGCIDAATAAASGEVQLAVAIRGVTGAPSGATAAPHATNAAAENIAVAGWELSLSPTGSATARVQVGEGGALEVGVSLRGAPAPAALQIPWAVAGGVSATGQTCAGAASAADFAGNALPGGTLNLANANSGTIRVQTLQDEVDESATGPECFTLSLGAQSTWSGAAGAVAVVGASAAFAEIADALRTLTASVRSATVDEDSVTGAGETANVEFTITLRGTQNPTENVEVPWTLRSPDNSLTLGGGAAGLGANSLAARDLAPGASLSGTVTFPADTDVSGAGNTITVPVAIAQDALNEGPERLQLFIDPAGVPRSAGGQSGDIPGTLVSTTTADATVSASDDLTVFLAPDPDQGTLTAGESARYTLSFGTTRVEGQVVPIVPTTQVRIPLSVQVGGAQVTLPPAAAAGGNAQIEADAGSSGVVVVPSGATQVTLQIPDAAIDAQSQSGAATLTIAAQQPTGAPPGAQARPATMQDAAAESQRETERQGRTIVVSAAPPPAQVAGWEITITQPDANQAPEGAGYRLRFAIEGDTARLSPQGVQIPWAVAASAASAGGLQSSPEDFAPSRSTPPHYNCGQSTRVPGACASFPSGRVSFAQGAAASRTLVVEIFDDGAEEGQTPEGFTLTLSPLAGPDAAQTTIAASGVQLGALQAEIPALRVDLRLADATAPEGASAEFVLTLSNFTGGARTTRPITVAYALQSGAQPGGAQLGADFTPPATPPGVTGCPAQHCALIPAGAQQGATHRIAVPLLLDGLLEPRETFTLTITAASGGGGTVRLQNAAGQTQTQLRATGTISDDADQSARRRQRVSALITVLDRQAALLASDAITARLSRPRAPGAQTAQLTLAGRNLLARTPAPPGATGTADAPAADAGLGLALFGAAGLPGAIGAAAATGATAAPEAGGAASPFGGLGAGLAGDANLGHRSALPSLAQLLSGSRFNAASFFDPAHLAAGLQVWGSGGFASLRGAPQQSGGALNYDGDTAAFFIGADRPLRQTLLAGLALGWSAGDLNFTDRADGFELRGNLSTHTLSLHPYIGWQPGPNLRTWLMLGFGSGSVDMEEREGSGASQLSRTLEGSAGSSQFMFEAGFSGRRQLSAAADLKLGLSLLRISSDVDGGSFHDGAALPGVRGRSTRLGGQAELGRSYQLSGLSLRPFGTLRFRLDRSSLVFAGEQRGMEKALDWGAGLQAAWPNLGLDGRLALSRQLSHTGHEEQRISVDLSYDLSGDSRGLTLALQSALRQSHPGALAAASALASAGPMQQSLSGEIAYGLAFRQFGHSGLLTPYGRFQLRQSAPQYAAGLRLTTTRHLSLGLESTFTPPAANATPAYGLRLTGSLRF